MINHNDNDIITYYSSNINYNYYYKHNLTIFGYYKFDNYYQFDTNFIDNELVYKSITKKIIIFTI